MFTDGSFGTSKTITDKDTIFHRLFTTARIQKVEDLQKKLDAKPIKSLVLTPNKPGIWRKPTAEELAVNSELGKAYVLSGNLRDAVVGLKVLDDELSHAYEPRKVALQTALEAAGKTQDFVNLFKLLQDKMLFLHMWHQYNWTNYHLHWHPREFAAAIRPLIEDKFEKEQSDLVVKAHDIIYVDAKTDVRNELESADLLAKHWKLEIDKFIIQIDADKKIGATEKSALGTCTK